MEAWTIRERLKDMRDDGDTEWFDGCDVYYSDGLYHVNEKRLNRTTKWDHPDEVADLVACCEAVEMMFEVMKKEKLI